MVEWRGEPAVELDQNICRELVRALRTERGFSGALSLVDRPTGAILLIVFWETEEEATLPLPPSLAELIGAHLEGGGSTVWEVGARA
jgi:hypothetical protein